MVTLFKSGDLIRQRAYRVILEAMSRPGRICKMPDPTLRQGRFDFLLIVLETLLDHESTHCMIEADGLMLLKRRLHEATKSPQTVPEKADFIIAPHGSTRGRLIRAKRGLPEYPDMSATVIYGIDSLSCEKSTPLRCSLRGPGIVDSLALPAMEGLDFRELTQLCTINLEFPLGVDALFVDPKGHLIALPRSTQIHIKNL